MRCNLLTSMAIMLALLITGCSTFSKIVYRPDINQGNYLTQAEVAQIHRGMTQQQVAYVLGTPMMHDPFGSQTWYYIFRQQPGHKKITQQTLTLTFDNSGILTDIQNKPSLTQ